MSEKSSKYCGGDNLQVMEYAANYNRQLFLLAKRWASKNDRILDFGAGIGTFSEMFQKEFFGVECLEPDESQAKIIKEKGLVAYCSSESIAGKGLDYIYSLNVLEHIEDDASILEEINRMLKPGGKIFIYVPAMQVLFSSMDEKVGHFRRYSRGQLVRLVNKAGFEAKASGYVDSLGFFVTLLYKLLGSKEGDISIRQILIYDRYIFPISHFIDRLTGWLFGKNVYIYAEKRNES